MVNHLKSPSCVGRGPRASSCVGRGLRASVHFILFALFCSLCLSITVPIFANEATDLTFIRKFNTITVPKQREIVHFNPQETSELKLAATGLIRLYQKFISSQDGPSCNFVPTCSRFGMACIQEYGVVRGIFLTADRLLRCNGSQSRHHHKDEETGKYIDLVSDYETVK